MKQEIKSQNMQEESKTQLGQEDLFKKSLQVMLKQELTEEEVRKMDLILSGLSEEEQEG